MSPTGAKNICISQLALILKKIEFRATANMQRALNALCSIMQETVYRVGSGGLANGRWAFSIIHNIPRCIDGSHSMADTRHRHNIVWNIATTMATSTSPELDWLWALIMPDATPAASAAAASTAAGVAGIAAM